MLLKMDQEITGRETKAACLNVVWKAVGLILCLEGVREVNTRIGCVVAQATEDVYICVEIGMWLK